MSSETRLRQALLELSDVPPPPDLADGALTRARRTRRRTAVALVACVGVLAALAVTVPTLALGRSAPAPTGAMPARPVVLQYLSYRPDSVTTLRPGGYGKSPWDYTYPSPDGRLAVVIEWPGRVDGRPRIRTGIVPMSRIDDPAAVRWLNSGFLGRDFQWSPDSRRVWTVTTHGSVTEDGDDRSVDTVTGHVIDADSLAVRTVTFSLNEPQASLHLSTFGPHGTGLTWAFGADDHHRQVGELQVLDDRGRIVRRFPIGDLSSLPDQPFSPDGRYVVLSSAGPGSSTQSTRVYDLRTGALVGRTPGTAAGWHDDGSYLVASGRTLERVELASGRVVGRWTVGPPGAELAKVWVGQVSGPLPPGAIVL
jgi:hypothetical protein